MDFDQMARKAQQIYNERGGAEAAKGDLGEVEEIVKSDGSLVDKAKQIAKALKEPGADPSHGSTGGPGTPSQA